MSEGTVLLVGGDNGGFVLAGGTIYWDGSIGGMRPPSDPYWGMIPANQMPISMFTPAVIILAGQMIGAVAGMAYDGCGWDAGYFAAGAAAALAAQQWGSYQGHINNLGNCVMTGWQNGYGEGGEPY